MGEQTGRGRGVGCWSVLALNRLSGAVLGCYGPVGGEVEESGRSSVSCGVVMYESPG